MTPMIPAPPPGEPQFVPGMHLARALFQEVIKPALARSRPTLRYAAGLFGPGSDVLGYDTARSMDHDWGPRCVLVVDTPDDLQVGEDIRRAVSDAMPMTFRGFPALFQDAPDDPGVVVPADPSRGTPTRHRVEITTLDALQASLDYAPGDDADPAFWLSNSDQQLLEITAGEVFRDDTGDLSSWRSKLAFYPEHIWRYRMAALWMRISQIEPFVGRTGEVSDEIGSFVIAARLVEDIMRLALSQAGQYAPYAKWLGTAFSRLPVSDVMQPHLDAARHAPTWREREAGIVAATSVLVRSHNALGLTGTIDPSPRPFHTRPFRVIDAARVATALGESLRGTALAALPIGVGGLDQFVDSTDALKSRWLRLAVREAIAGQIHGHTLRR